MRLVRYVIFATAIFGSVSTRAQEVPTRAKEVPTRAQEVTWVPTVGPYGGDASVAISQKGSVFLSTVYGLHRSTDGGASWTVQPDMHSIWSAPDSVLWAGTSDGIFRSDNDGGDWRQSGLEGTTVRMARVDGDGTLWALTDSLLRSSDGGTSWITSMAGLAALSIVGYVCPVSMLAPIGGQMHVGTAGCGPFGYGGFVAAWDADSSKWRGFDSGPGRSGGSPTGLIEAQNGDLWVSVQPSDIMSSDGLYHAVAGTWSRSTAGAFLSVAQSQDGTLFAGSPEGLIESFDGGDNWNDAGLAGIPVHSIAFAPEGDVYVASRTFCYPAYDPPLSCRPGFGAFVRRVGEAGWEPVTPELPTAHTLALAAGGEGMWAATVNGLWLLDTPLAPWQPVAVDASESWQNDGSVAVPFREFPRTRLRVTPWGDVIGTGEYERTLYRFDDAIARWTPMGQQLGYLTYTEDVVAVAPGILIVAANNVVYRSTDRGNSWDTVLSESVKQLGRAASSSVLAVRNDGDGIWRSDDSGESWSRLPGAPTDVTHIVPALGDTLYAAASGGFYVSTDLGDTWLLVSGGPAAGRYRIEYHVDAAGVLFAVNGDGVLISRDGGATWDVLATGESLPANSSILAAALDRYGYLYAATTQHGVWRTSEPVSVGVRNTAVDQEGATVSGFPNPFGRSATLRVTLPAPDWVRVTIFDLLGRQVGRPIAVQCPAGRCDIPLEGTTLAAGQYAIRVKLRGQLELIYMLKAY